MLWGPSESGALKILQHMGWASQRGTIWPSIATVLRLRTQPGRRALSYQMDTVLCFFQMYSSHCPYVKIPKGVFLLHPHRAGHGKCVGEGRTAWLPALALSLLCTSTLGLVEPLSILRPSPPLMATDPVVTHKSASTKGDQK